MLTRRRLITSLATTLFVAPAIVRASSLMAVKPTIYYTTSWWLEDGGPSYVLLLGLDQFGQGKVERIPLPLDWSPGTMWCHSPLGSITSVTFL